MKRLALFACLVALLATACAASLVADVACDGSGRMHFGDGGISVTCTSVGAAVDGADELDASSDADADADVDASDASDASASDAAASDASDASDAGADLRPVALFEGDSLTNNHFLCIVADPVCGMASRQWPMRITQTLSIAEVYNYAVSGSSWAAVSQASRKLTVLQYIQARPGRRCLVHAWAGTNDITTTSTAAQIYDMQCAYGAWVHSIGCLYAGATIIDREWVTNAQATAAEQREKAEAFNELQRARGDAGTSCLDLLVDYAAHPDLGPDGARNGAAFLTDKIHPSELGAGIIAGIADPLIAALME